MNRRQWLKAGIGIATVAAAPKLIAGTKATTGAIEYTPELYSELIASGDAFLLDFSASWCSTCRAQERVVNALMEGNDAYGTVKFVKADWDMYGNSELAKELAIPRRSTLVMFKGGEEVGRVVAQTSEPAIEALFKLVA